MRLGKVLAGAVLATMFWAAPASAEEKLDESKNPWRGSALTYEHTVSAISLDKSHDPTWNPFYAHMLTLRPEWHFSDSFFARAQFDIEQELTNSDDTVRQRQWMWSDLRLDAAYAGYKEPTTGIKVAGDVRLTVPTSRASHASSLILGVAPSVALKRKFDVMRGLVVGYAARHAWNFHRYSSPAFDEAGIQGNVDALQRAMLINTGVSNPSRILIQGPTVSFSPIERLEVFAMMNFVRTKLYDFDPASGKIDTGAAETGASSETQVRHAQMFNIGANYQFLDYLGVSLGASSVYGDLKPDGTYRTPFFNRSTALYLDMNLDFDALYSKI